MGLADEALVLLIGDHDNALFVPAGDELRSLGAGAAKEFAKARLGGLQLPAGLRSGFSGSCAPSCGFWFWHIFRSVLTSLTRLLYTRSKRRARASEDMRGHAACSSAAGKREW